MTCEHCRQQMLPLLYDLLDPLERETALAHVEGCADCRDALKSAREQQGMMAEAVRAANHEIVFKAPSKATPSSTAPTILMQRPPRRFSLLNRWAAAASILLILFGAGSVVGFGVWREHSAAFHAKQELLAKAKNDLAKTQEELNQKKGQTQQEIKAIQEQIDTLLGTWKKKETETRKVIEEQGAQLTIKGPQNFLAGANNEYQIERRNDVLPGKLGQPDKSPYSQNQINIRATNQRNETLHEQQVNLQQNVMQNSQASSFTLPSYLAIKPGDQVALEFQTQDAKGNLVTLRDNLKLVFPEYVTHLTTDRPMYRPGETVRFRSLTLERFSLRPPQRPFHLRFRIIGPNNVEFFNKEFTSTLVAGPNNEPIRGPQGEELHGLGVGDFNLPADLPGGQYTLFVSEVNERFNEEKRAFLVNRWQAPRFTKELTFHRSSYGPGDQVKMQVRVVPAAGQPIGGRANIQVIAGVTVDGGIVMNQTRDVDNEGRVEFEFNLPNQIAKGVGTVTIECMDGGNRETLVRTLPLVIRDLQIEFYPEGGELVAGVPNRVYFQARTPTNKPAEFTGTILDGKNQEIVRIRTVSDDLEPGINQGLGHFTFTPQVKRNYSLRVDSPLGIDRTINLPPVKEKGVVLHVPQGVVDNQINVVLHSVKAPRELLVGAYCRGRVVDHKFVKAAANQPTQVTLRPIAGVGGVYRITVFEKTGVGADLAFRPLAERLIYRKSPEAVKVTVTSDRPSYQPGGPVELKLQAKDEKQLPVPAIALVAVVDTSVLKLADEKTARGLATHFFLTTEVRHPEDLENADILLSDHPKAAAALDLLLGCQGWRRFAEQDPQKFQERQQQAKAPIFLANSAMVSQFLDSEQKQIEKLDQNFVKSAVELHKQLAEKEKLDAGPVELQNNVLASLNEIEAVESAVEEAHFRMREIRAYFIQFGLGGAMLGLLFFGFFLISVGLRRHCEGECSARRWLTSGFALLAVLFIISVVGTFAFMGENLNNDFRFGRHRDEKLMRGAPIGFAQKEGIPIAVVDEIETPLEADRLNEEPARKEKKPVAADLQMVRNVLMAEQPQRGIVNANNVQMKPPGAEVPEERQLRQQGNYQGLLYRSLGRKVQLPAVRDACVVRVYAHQHQPSGDAVRRDFTETIYWHPVLVMPDGMGMVKFDLSDAVTRFQVLVMSHTFDGRLGTDRIEITSKLPFSVEPTVPIEVSDKDQITIPVAVNNDLPKPTTASLSARGQGVRFVDSVERSLTLDANQRKRELFKLLPDANANDAMVRIVGRSDASSDAVERRFKIVPDGFPITGSHGGVLENVPIEHEITLPATWIPGSLQVQAHFYPSPLAELQSGLEALLREPTGCFEQSSSSNYPNVMVLQYMKQQANQGNATLEKRSRQLLQNGYQKLTAFECIDPAQPGSRRGYEWFGQTAPPHEALTAYGLLQFRDMARIHPVEPDMLDRTEKYLYGQRDGKGGFQRNPNGIDQFGRASNPVTNAYIVWALSEGGTKQEIGKELAALRESCKTSKDPYFLALVALGQLNSGESAAGIEILRQVLAFQKESGLVAGAETSITGSQGRDLDVETTSLAVLGWLKANHPGEFHPALPNAVRWLGQQRRGAGSFGGTQATILALKAMVAYQQKTPRILQGGDVEMSVRPGGGNMPSNRLSFSARSQDPLTLKLGDLDSLHPGKNTIRLESRGDNSLPYTLTWSYRTVKPANDPKTPVKLSAKFNQDSAREGGTIKLTALVENVSGKGQGMTVAILGLPGGVSIPEDAAQLKALAALQANGTKPGKIAAWELRGRDLVLYWRDLAPDAKIEVELDLICRLPGVYRGPASRAYLYYDADRKYWIDPLSLRIDEVGDASPLAK